MQEEELCAVFGSSLAVEVYQVLLRLQFFQKAKPIIRYGKLFWIAAGASFPAGE
jgi:hypothetical protein